MKNPFVPIDSNTLTNTKLFCKAVEPHKIKEEVDTRSKNDVFAEIHEISALLFDIKQSFNRR